MKIFTDDLTGSYNHADKHFLKNMFKQFQYPPLKYFYMHFQGE